MFKFSSYHKWYIQAFYSTRWLRNPFSIWDWSDEIFALVELDGWSSSLVWLISVSHCPYLDVRGCSGQIGPLIFMLGRRIIVTYGVPAILYISWTSSRIYDILHLQANLTDKPSRCLVCPYLIMYAIDLDLFTYRICPFSFCHCKTGPLQRCNPGR